MCYCVGIKAQCVLTTWWPLVVPIDILDPRDNKYLLSASPVSLASYSFYSSVTMLLTQGGW